MRQLPVLLALLATPLCAHAQADVPVPDSLKFTQFQLGVRGGLVFPLVRISAQPDLRTTAVNPGYLLGASLETYFGGHWGLATGLSYMRRVVDFTELAGATDGGYRVRSRVGYSTIEIPLCLAWRSVDSLRSYGWKVNAGLSFDYGEAKRATVTNGLGFGQGSTFSDSLPN